MYVQKDNEVRTEHNYGFHYLLTFFVSDSKFYTFPILLHRFPPVVLNQTVRYCNNQSAISSLYNNFISFIEIFILCAIGNGTNRNIGHLAIISRDCNQLVYRSHAFSTNERPFLANVGNRTDANRSELFQQKSGNRPSGAHCFYRQLRPSSVYVDYVMISVERHFLAHLFIGKLC